MTDANEQSFEYVPEALIEAARRLRQDQTSVEDMLWECLRDRRLGGLKFRRQHPIKGTPYIVDFCCYENRLVIELDGGIHDQQVEADQARQQGIEELGYRVVRFKNEVVDRDLRAVLVKIRQLCE